jgi:hypothetical protein
VAFADYGTAIDRLIKPFGFSVKIDSPLSKLLTHVVPNGNPNQISAFIGHCPELPCIHRTALRFCR